MSTVSRLKWNYGIGWLAVSLVIIFVGITALTQGFIQIASFFVLALLILFNANQWRKWNKPGWQQVHYRAMLTYSELSGAEMAYAQNEGREFSRLKACTALAHRLTGPGREANVAAMMDALAKERNEYFSKLLSRFGSEAEPRLDRQTLLTLADQMPPLEISPLHVIANVVENTFGGQEAAKYVIALATGKAK